MFKFAGEGGLLEMTVRPTMWTQHGNHLPVSILCQPEWNDNLYIRPRSRINLYAQVYATVGAPFPCRAQEPNQGGHGMENREAIEQIMRNYEAANASLLKVWDQLSPETLDKILEKQQHRLEQIADRLYHEEQWEEENERIQDTLARYHWANLHLHAHWETMAPEERVALMRKQWNRLQELRNRVQRIH
jgi:selenocysteine-specific translation elongation factor